MELVNQGTRTASKWMGRSVASVQVFALSLALSSPLGATVNVSFSSSAPTSLQADFIAATTSQFLGSLVKSPYFSNTWAFTATGKNAFTPPPPPPVTVSSSGTYVVQIGQNTRMIYQSTAAINDVYAYGWVAGQIYERRDDLAIISGILAKCSDPSLWSIAIDSSTCSTVLGSVTSAIAQKNLDSPIPVNIPPDWGF